VGTNAELAVVGREGHALDPLQTVGQELALSVGVSLGSDGDLTIIASNAKPFRIAGHST